MDEPMALRLAEQFCGDWELIDDDAVASLARLLVEVHGAAHAAGRAEMRETLKPWVEHASLCYDGMERGRPCSCGLSIALDELKG